MKGTLRILILEDHASDAELMEWELKKAGISFTSLRVETRKSFEAALADFNPDLILSDYTLPGYNGRDALEFARKNIPDIPVVMVTGTIGEETAVELLKAGAKDYVLKDRMARLPSAVERALAEAEITKAIRETDRRLRESEALALAAGECSAPEAAATIRVSRVAPAADFRASEPVVDLLERRASLLEAVDEAVRTFAVSREVVLRRLLTVRAISRETYRQTADAWKATRSSFILTKRKGRKIPHYATHAELGTRFISRVLAAHERGLVTDATVTDYLALRLKHLSKLQQRIPGE